MKRFSILPVVVLGMIAAPPAEAADDLRPDDRFALRSAAYAGAAVRIPFGGSGGVGRTPSAGLRIGIDHVSENLWSAAPRSVHRSSAVELSFAGRDRPTLLIAGAPARDLERRLGISTAGAVGIGVGVALLAVLAVAASSDMPDEITP